MSEGGGGPVKEPPIASLFSVRRREIASVGIEGLRLVNISQEDMAVVVIQAIAECRNRRLLSIG